jgi:hypothetical protein
MAVQADFGRSFRQHAGILAGMIGVAGLAVTLLDRLMLRRARDIVMTGQAESAFKGLEVNIGTLDLVTVVAVAASHRRMDNLPKKSRITGTVLRVAFDAPGCDRIPLVGRNELGAFRFMTGSTQVAACHVQQCRII